MDQSLVSNVGQPKTAPNAFEIALDQALTDFHELMVTDKSAEEQGAAYWKAAADRFHDQAVEAQKRGDQVNLLRELLACIPDFMFTQIALDTARDHHDRTGFLEIRRRAIHFNDLVEEVVQAFPGIRASALEAVLTETANSTIKDRQLREMIPYIMHSVIRGAQHEVAFGQLLRQTGRTFHSGTVNEDAHGIDYIVQSQRGEMRIDVKSSRHEITKRGEYHNLYVIDGGDGLITMYSLVNDNDLEDFFEVTPEVAQKKGAELESILKAIESGDQATLVNHPAVITTSDE